MARPRKHWHGQSRKKQLLEEKKRRRQAKKLFKKGRIKNGALKPAGIMPTMQKPAFGFRPIGAGFIPALTSVQFQKLRAAGSVEFGGNHFLQLDRSRSNPERIVFEMIPKATHPTAKYFGSFEINLQDKTIRWLRGI